jgi:hypothetical protein
LASGSGSASLRRDRRIALWLGAAAFLAYLPFVHGHFTGTDEMGVFLTTRALYEEGSFEVRAGPHRFRGREGRTYAHFAPGLPVLALPFYALGDVAERSLPGRWVEALSGRRQELERIDTRGSPQTFAVALYPPLASAALVALFFLVQRRLGASVESALAASALLGGGTYVASHSVYFLRHTTEAIPWLACFLALLAYRESGRPRDLALGSLWASLTLLVAVPATVGVPALAGYGLFAAWPRLARAGTGQRVRLLAAGMLPALGAVALHAMHNSALWGGWFESPMVAQRHGFTTPLHVGLAGFLLSPGVSLFLYSPPLLLVGLMLPSFWRERRAECVTALAASLSLLVFCAGFSHWHGLWSAPGPRYLFVLTPLLLLPLGRWLDAHAGRRARQALWALGAAGLAVQLVLLLSRWSAVIRAMGYVEAAQRDDLSFLWEPGRSPLAGSVRALGEGQVDAWWFGLVTGFDGAAAAPGAAALLLGVWASVAAFVWLRLRRQLRGG